MRKIRKNDRGFTLTELAIVLGIMGSIMGAIWVAAAKVSLNNKVQKANAEILSIYAGYQSFYSTRAMDATGDITCMGAQSSGVFPADMINQACIPGNGATFPVSPWGTQVQVNGDQAKNEFDIMVYGLNKQACVSLAASFLNSPSVTGEMIGPYGAWTVFNGTATLAQINTACGNVTNNFVYFSFAAR